MAIGKSKRQGKKGQKKKATEPFLKKEWYDVVAPKDFKKRQFTKTIGNKTIGIKVAAENMKGRVYEGNLADLDQATNKDQQYRKIKMQVMEVQGRNLLTQFHSLKMTEDKQRSLLSKWCTTVEAVIEAKTADGFTLRVFVMAFTTKVPGQTTKNCYAPTRLVRWVRHRMTTMIKKRFAKCDLNQAVKLLTSDILADNLYKRCNPILPLRDVKIFKVKVIRTPKYDGQKLVDSHGIVPVSIEDQARVVVVAEETAAAPAKEE